METPLSTFVCQRSLKTVAASAPKAEGQTERHGDESESEDLDMFNFTGMRVN